ncbi:MAG: exopolyphosphatase [Clostridiales bacterium]|jgi:nanoRNase/pAp phosphatase (c-di-AMP/oligoRNAs hydrolase)|nr:exopolyphosphatase [Clostridiales bacterium]
MDLLTRSDFDGLACATILRDIGVIGNLKFVHPKDLQAGLVKVTPNDILANVPYVEGCGMWFDHHASEWERLGQPQGFVGSLRRLDSAAHVVYDYYKDRNNLCKFDEMLTAVDKVDAGKLTAEEILEPYGWILLGFIMDPRTGLGRFREFRISNYQLMEALIEYCRTMRIDEILEQPDVKERVELYREQTELFKKMLGEHTKVHGNAIVTDLRGVDTIYAGNRFIIYSLYPECNISLWVVDGRNKQNVSIAVGYSILNRTSTADVGSTLLAYGGGGHKQVGTCQVPYDDCDRVLGELIGKLQ